MSGRSLLLPALILMSCVFCLLPAQVVQTGIIDGMVMDNDGNPVGGVFITITSSGVNAQKFSTISDFEGSFRVPGLPPGVYTIEGRLEGYYQEDRLRVELRVNQVQRVILRMLEGIQPEEPLTSDALFLRSLYSLPFYELIPEIKTTRYPVRMHWLRPERLMSDLRITRGELSIEGIEERQFDLSYDNIRLADPISGAYLIDPRYIPFHTSEVTTRFIGPYSRTPAGYLNLSSAPEVAIKGFHGAVSLSTTGDVFSADQPQFDDLKRSSFRGGAVLTKDFLERTSASFIISSSSDEYNYLLDPLDLQTDSSLFAEGSLTMTLSSGSQFSLRYLHLNNREENFNSVSGRRWLVTNAGAEIADTRERETNLIATRYRQRLSENIIIAYQLELARITSTLGPTSGDRELPTVVDAMQGIVYQGSLSGTWRDHEADRINGLINLEFFLDEITGTHQIRLGGEAEYVEAVQEWGFNGGELLNYRLGRRINYQYYTNEKGSMADPDSNSTLTRFSLYARDNWLINPRIMVNIGIRFDGTDIENSTSRVINWKAVSPRLGLSFDVFNNGTLLFRAGAARYFDQARVQWSMSDPYQIISVYNTGSLNALDLIPEGQPYQSIITSRYGYGDDYPFGNIHTDPPRTDEIFAAVEWSPNEELTFQVTANRRETDGILEDMDFYRQSDGNVVIGDFAGFNAALATDAGGETYHYFYPVPDYYGALDPVLYWGTDERLFRRYDAVSASLDMQLWQRLTVRSRYTWASIRGNIDISGEDITSRSTSQNSPSPFINAEGYLSSDIRHLVRLVGTYTLRDDFSVALMADYRSGMPYNRFLLNPNVYSLLYEIRADERGEEWRYDSLLLLGARMEKAFAFTNSRFVLAVEARNLLDERTTVVVDQRDTPDFGRELAVNAPRSLSFSLSFQF